MGASFKHRMEYILLRGALALLRWLPYRLALALACGVAGVIHYLARFRVATAHARIKAVLGPEISQREIRSIAWISWRNLCFNVVEMARFPRTDREDIDRMISNFDDNVEAMRSLHEGNRGFVLATMHMGNWEMGGVAVNRCGLPMFVIVRRQKNPLTDELLLQMRQSTGIEIVMNDKRVLKNIIRNLKDGKILAILPDVRARTPALDIDYLGGKANIGGGMALFARQTNLPILPAYGIREGWTRHKWRFLDPVYPDTDLEKKEDWRRMTQIVMGQFSAAVKANPEQYFWYNKRWVLDPLEPDNR